MPPQSQEPDGKTIAARFHTGPLPGGNTTAGHLGPQTLTTIRQLLLPFFDSYIHNNIYKRVIATIIRVLSFNILW